MIKTLMEEILTIALRETEIEYQDKSDKFSFLASLAKQFSVARK